MRVLIGYASAHGSTRGIAERIATRLRGHGHQVVLTALGPGVDPGGYGAVVLGSAVHDGKWLPEAAAFLRQHADSLAAAQVWLFSVSLLGEQGSAFRPAVARRLRAMRAQRGSEQPAGVWAAIRPAGQHDFAGAVAPEHWGAVGRLVFRVMGGHFGDYRDWAEIDAWADLIHRSLTEGGQC